MTQKARYFDTFQGGEVGCRLCPHGCLVLHGQRGLCGVRENQHGTLLTLNYAKAVALQNDPIEKKPFFHVLPGSLSFSVATMGCNLQCAHCQNHHISQTPRGPKTIPGRDTPARIVVEMAESAGSKTISFTYSEPTVFMEWAQDIAEAALPEGLRCVSVTNGYTSASPIRDIASKLTAANVDLKAFRDDFYQKICKAKLQPVLDTIRLMRELGIWVEVTTLLIPGLNDDEHELRDMAEFIASVDKAIPWHLSRFHPDHRMIDTPKTSLQSIQTAREIGRNAGLKFVYSGNVWGDAGEHTHCPVCDHIVIERHGFSVRRNLLQKGACPKCHEPIEGIWD